MGVRQYLSSQPVSGRIELTDIINWQQLTTTIYTDITAPVKIFVDMVYTGTVAVSIADADASQIRVINAGQCHYFDEVSSPHKLWVKPSAIDAGVYLYYRCGRL